MERNLLLYKQEALKQNNGDLEHCTGAQVHLSRWLMTDNYYKVVTTRKVFFKYSEKKRKVFERLDRSLGFDSTH